MHRSIGTVLCPAVASVVLFCGCGDKGGRTDGDAQDTVDAPDGADSATDTEPDTGADVPADGEEDVDTDTDTDAEDVVGEDVPCIPSGVGSPPAEDLDACLEAVSCIAPPFGMAMDPMELCYMLSIFRIGPIYGEAFDVLGAWLYEMFFVSVEDNASCVAAAADCDAVFECMNGGTASGSCSTPHVDFPIGGVSCTGDVVTMCINTEAGTTNGREFEYDCTDLGLSCVTVTGLGAVCGSTACTTAGDPGCSGDSIEYCVVSGALIEIDCNEMARDSGGTCGDVDPSTYALDAGCLPTGASCDPTSDAPECRGDSLFECDTDFNAWVGIDCTLVGTGWFCNDSVTPADCSPDITGWTCTLDLEPECDCDDVILCNMFTGTDLRVHCPDYGFSTCGDTDPSTTEIEVGCID